MRIAPRSIKTPLSNTERRSCQHFSRNNPTPQENSLLIVTPSIVGLPKKCRPSLSANDVIGTCNQALRAFADTRIISSLSFTGLVASAAARIQCTQKATQLRLVLVAEACTVWKSQSRLSKHWLSQRSVRFHSSSGLTHCRKKAKFVFQKGHTSQ